MTESKRPPMSPLGRSLFEMMNAINRASALQRRIPPVKPHITHTIKRSSQKEKNK